jgi:hypothetical protein
MATLRLKKPPEQIGDRPLDLFMGKFAVMRQARNAHSIRFTSVHDTFGLAQKEAVRLNQEMPTERYLIVFVAGYEDWKV